MELCALIVLKSASVYNHLFIYITLYLGIMPQQNWWNLWAYIVFLSAGLYLVFVSDERYTYMCIVIMAMNRFITPAPPSHFQHCVFCFIGYIKLYKPC